jgi:hypothetical protein
MKVKVVLVTAEVGIVRETGEALSTDLLLAKDLSKSMSVGTRKMVNYA